MQFKLLCSEQAPIGSSALHTSSILYFVCFTYDDQVEATGEQERSDDQCLTQTGKSLSGEPRPSSTRPLPSPDSVCLVSFFALSLSLSFTSQRRKQQKENCFVRSEWLITPYLTYQNAHTNETTTKKEKIWYIILLCSILLLFSFFVVVVIEPELSLFLSFTHSYAERQFKFNSSIPLLVQVIIYSPKSLDFELLSEPSVTWVKATAFQSKGK